MPKQRFVYAIYIKASPEKVFHALTDGPTTREYWFHENVSDWKPGSSWEHRRLDGSAADVVGNVVECDPPLRLVTTWAAPADRDDATKHSRVTFELKSVADTTRLVVTHDDLEPQMLDDASEGWSSVLSSLKSLLETGRSLGDLWAGRHTA
jgi:uncharacterized protein YndB with AHSA1/START domain